jgi:DNA-binding transcriptional ArsR family regulator
MSKSILDNLFGSRVRVKLLKLLYRQHPATFAMSELVVRVQEPAFIVRRELTVLRDTGLVKRFRIGSGAARDRERFGLSHEFDFFEELRDLVLKPSPAETDRLIKRIGGLGRIKLAVVAGIFVSQPDDLTYETPADLFIVGDDIDKGRLTKFLKSLESEMGTEIRFSTMEKDEFKYRYEMFDRFLRVLLEGPHRKIIDKAI